MHDLVHSLPVWLIWTLYGVGGFGFALWGFVKISSPYGGFWDDMLATFFALCIGAFWPLWVPILAVLIVCSIVLMGTLALLEKGRDRVKDHLETRREQRFAEHQKVHRLGFQPADDE